MAGVVHDVESDPRCRAPKQDSQRNRLPPDRSYEHQESVRGYEGRQYNRCFQIHFRTIPGAQIIVDHMRDRVPIDHPARSAAVGEFE